MTSLPAKVIAIEKGVPTIENPRLAGIAVGRPGLLIGQKIEFLLKGGGRQCSPLFSERYPQECSHHPNHIRLVVDVHVVWNVRQYKRLNWISVNEFLSCRFEPVNNSWPSFIK